MPQFPNSHIPYTDYIDGWATMRDTAITVAAFSGIDEMDWKLFLQMGVTLLVAFGGGWTAHHLSARRDHESDWRKLKLTQYQEYVLALSGVIAGRDTPGAHRRYADAVNSMTLVAPRSVLEALHAFQVENAFSNKGRDSARLEVLQNALIRAMRNDVHPSGPKDPPALDFRLFGIPPNAVDDVPPSPPGK